VQGRSVDVWKENILEDLKVGKIIICNSRRILAELKKK